MTWLECESNGSIKCGHTCSRASIPPGYSLLETWCSKSVGTLNGWCVRVWEPGVGWIPLDHLLALGTGVLSFQTSFQKTFSFYNLYPFVQTEYSYYFGSVLTSTSYKKLMRVFSDMDRKRDITSKSILGYAHDHARYYPQDGLPSVLRIV